MRRRKARHYDVVIWRMLERGSIRHNKKCFVYRDKMCINAMTYLIREEAIISRLDNKTIWWCMETMTNLLVLSAKWEKHWEILLTAFRKDIANGWRGIVIGNLVFQIVTYKGEPVCLRELAVKWKCYRRSKIVT